MFLTNNFALSAITITELYRCRWQVELFFKWIKQHLRIKVFFGTSENAVKTQLWIAVSVYLLVAIIKKRLNLSASLYEMLQISQLLNNIITDDIQALSANQLGKRRSSLSVLCVSAVKCPNSCLRISATICVNLRLILPNAFRFALGATRFASLSI